MNRSRLDQTKSLQTTDSVAPGGIEPPSRSPLSDRERRALTVLRNSACLLHPSRVAYLCGDRHPHAGTGWRNTLDALERKGFVRSTYQYLWIRSGGRDYAITRKGLQALAQEAKHDSS